MKNDNILITREGKEKIEKELHTLISIDRVKVIKEIQQAREQGDLRENSDFDAAKQKQANVEERIKNLSDKLTKLKVVSSSSKSIGIGTMIEFKNLNSGKKSKIMIVGSFESNPFAKIKHISYDTPFANAIIKNKNKIHKGSIIEIPLESKSYKIEILNIMK